MYYTIRRKGCPLLLLIGWIMLAIGCQSRNTLPTDTFSPDELIARVAEDLGIKAEQLDPISIIHQDITGDGAADFICVLQDFSSDKPKTHIYAFVGTLEGDYRLVGKNNDLLPTVVDETLMSTIYLESDFNSFTLYIEEGELNGEYYVFEYRNNVFLLTKATLGVMNYDTGQLFEFSLYEYELAKASLSDLPVRSIRNRLIEKSQEYKPDAQLLSVPIDSVRIPVVPPSPVAILRTSGYERDQLPKNIRELKWLGLFFVNGEYVLRNTLLKTDTLLYFNNRAETLIADSLIYVHVLSPDSCVLLMANTGLSPQTVMSIPVEQEVLWPGQSWDIPLKGTVYQLLVDGVMLNDQFDDRGNIYAHFIANYKLKMTRKVGYNVREAQVVAATPRFAETMYRIKWVGDLDGDGWLDLLIDVSEHLDREKIVLFLSSHQDQTEIVHPVAETTSVRSMLSE